MSKGRLANLSAMIAADPECTQTAELLDCYITTEWERWEKRATLVGSGQCAVLVQAATGAPAPARVWWRKGPKVKENMAVRTGTAIATFDAEGRYPPGEHRKHAAIFIAHDVGGIVVLDQWADDPAKPKPSRRTIKFKNGVGSPSNDGDCFWVIVTPKILNLPDATVAQHRRTA
jgi:hypothetical protein